jgi:hypothetical protein
MIQFLAPIIISMLGGIAYSFLFMHTQQIQFSTEKNAISMLITFGRILFLGFFLYILLKYWPTHSILIVTSFLTSFIMTTIAKQKS